MSQENVEIVRRSFEAFKRGTWKQPFATSIRMWRCTNPPGFRVPRCFVATRAC